MNTSAAHEVIAAVDADSTLRQLRTQRATFETKLAATQSDIAERLAELERVRAAASPHGSTEDYLAILERPVQTVESLQEVIRKLRMDEGRYSEGLRMLRRLITQRESAAFYENLPVLQREQSKLAERVVDHMLSLCELWLDERELRAPLLSISKFEAADSWSTHCVTSQMVREKIGHLERISYKPTADQLRRLQATEQREQQ